MNRQIGWFEEIEVWCPGKESPVGIETVVGAPLLGFFASGTMQRKGIPRESEVITVALIMIHSCDYISHVCEVG